MSRWIVVILGVVMLAAPAFATVYSNMPFNGNGSQSITITLDIPCYTQVYWNNTADQNIFFNSLVGAGGDWYRLTLMGQYLANSTASQDPLGAGYYESYDAAYFWLDSNCTTTMKLTSGGDLSNGAATMPTWYTVCLTNNTGSSPFGFINNSARLATCGNAPGDGPANYMELVGGALNIDMGSGDGDSPCDSFWPNQDSFAMAPTASFLTYGFLGYAQGTVLFHARVLRSGLANPGGTYTTTLEVLFS